VIKIDSEAFADCTSLTSVTISETVNEIVFDAFNNCNVDIFNAHPDNPVYESVNGKLKKKKNKKKSQNKHYKQSKK